VHGASWILKATYMENSADVRDETPSATLNPNYYTVTDQKSHTERAIWRVCALSDSFSRQSCLASVSVTSVHRSYLLSVIFRLFACLKVWKKLP